MSFIFGVLQHFEVLDPLQLNLSTPSFQHLSVAIAIDNLRQKPSSYATMQITGNMSVK